MTCTDDFATLRGLRYVEADNGLYLLAEDREKYDAAFARIEREFQYLRAQRYQAGQLLAEAERLLADPRHLGAV